VKGYIVAKGERGEEKEDTHHLDLAG